MKVEMTPQPGKGPGINIHGPQVTEFVWKLFSYSISANRIDCPWYNARQKAGAFFQGGSDKPSNWVFIEFWKPDTAFHYVNLVNRALAFVDDQGLPVLTNGRICGESFIKRFKGLMNFYECEYYQNGNVFTFTPNSAILVTTLVEWNIMEGNTFNPANLPVDASDLIWGLYQDIGQNGSDYITDKDKRKQLIDDLRSVADQLQTTL